MCGIAGAVSRDPAFDVGPIVTRLTAALAHRGPDGEGFHFARGRSVGLGNRRLSIVDLPGGAQPIASEDERVWVVYNGEVYNHLDLRRELIALGHRFRTNADTEVLVHGFEQWGAELFGRLNGIFAFALFFFNDTATTEIYTLSLHDALPIFRAPAPPALRGGGGACSPRRRRG